MPEHPSPDHHLKDPFHLAETIDEPEPRWQAALSVLVVGGLYLAVPKSLSIGPRWLLLAVIGVLLVPTLVTFHLGKHSYNRILGFMVNALVTLWLVWSVGLLVYYLPLHKESATTMLRSAIALWLTNILVFANWYWRLDAGGPYKRSLRPGHTDGAFFFPQMAMTPEARSEAGETRWSPTFVDYLFLAFNTSTALSPADTAVLSRWAKALMMLQALISLTVVAFVAARAVNIL